MSQAALLPPIAPVNCVNFQGTKADAWTQTFSGGQFHGFAPRPEEIEIADIARALSMECRYNGHLKRSKDFYSVAEHSWIMCSLVSDPAKPYALMHDGAEAFIRDVAAPYKKHLPDYQALEKIVMAAIIERFKVPITPAILEEVHTADKWLAHIEAKELLANTDLVGKWGAPPKFKPRVIVRPEYFGLLPRRAEHLFLGMYYALKQQNQLA